MLVSTKDLAFESVLLLALGAYATSLIRQDLLRSTRRFVFTFLEGQDPVLNSLLPFLFPLAQQGLVARLLRRD